MERCHNPLGACAVAPSGSRGLEPRPPWGLRRGGCWAGRTLRPGQLADRRRRKDGSAAQVSLMHWPRWPREGRVSLYLGDCRDDEPRWPRARGLGGAAQAHAGQPVPRAQVQGAGRAWTCWPGGPAPRLRGGPSEPCSRCRRGQPGVEGLPQRRWTTRATGRTGSRPRVCRCSHGLVLRYASCAASLSLPGRLETDDRGGQEP